MFQLTLFQQEWNISPGMNKKFNGKVLYVKNSYCKRGTKLIISYWTVEVTEDDGEDESTTLVQFVTYVILNYLVPCIYTFYRFYVFKTYPNVFQVIYDLG